jgi:membrane-bound acyltransferase YfiQ involved in biofilm formation
MSQKPFELQSIFVVIFNITKIQSNNINGPILYINNINYIVYYLHGYKIQNAYRVLVRKPLYDRGDASIELRLMLDK